MVTFNICADNEEVCPHLPRSVGSMTSVGTVYMTTTYMNTTYVLGTWKGGVHNQDLLSVYGWERSQPLNEVAMYVISSAIG